MNEAYTALLSFLEQNHFLRTAKALRDEIEGSDKSLARKPNPRAAKNLFRIIDKTLRLNEKDQGRTRNRDNMATAKRRYKSKALTPEETENIMEGFLNKLVHNPTLLEDEKLNARIEKLFDNPTFQRMVESTDVFQDMSNVSFAHSHISKNLMQDIKQEANKNLTNSSWVNESVPRFGKSNVSGLLEEEISLHHQQPPPKNQEIKISNQYTNNQDMLLQKKPPSMEDILADNNMDFTPKGADQQELIKREEASPFHEKGEEPGKGISMIQVQGTHSFFNDSQSQILTALENPFQNAVDEYTDDDDPGFDLYEVAERDFPRVSKQLAETYGFPARSCQIDLKKKDEKESVKDENRFTPTDDSGLILQDLKGKKDEKDEKNDLSNKAEKDKKTKGYIHLPGDLKHPPSNDNFYPVEFENVIYDCFNMRVIYDRERTGFEETKDFPIVINSIIAGRYQILQYLGSAAFSKAIECLDIVTQQRVCMKVIENNKDYFDQSVDEIKLLKFINYNGDVEDKHVLKFYDFFYHKEHLFIITELLKENLYEFGKFNRENEKDAYFTVGRLQTITKQVLVALDYIHGLHLIHCDLKPENILMKDYENAEVKVIDFGSSCFIHDHLSSYVQSRSYRAPEVIIGCKYDYKVDMWSLGCILAEMWTGNVLFQNDTVQGLLARVIGIIGPFPEKMLKEGRLVSNFFTKEKLLYQEGIDNGDSHAYMDNSDAGHKKKVRTGKIQLLVPKKSSLKHRLRTNDVYFLDFVRWLLELDPAKRPTAREALSHPWLLECKYNDPPYVGKRNM